MILVFQNEGDQVAVKVMNRQLELRSISYEVDAVRKLPKHKNIVQFLAIEEEVTGPVNYCYYTIPYIPAVHGLQRNTRNTVIVMELCNAGSLYEVVDAPENAFGLEETQFKQVISDVGECTIELIHAQH